MFGQKGKADLRNIKSAARAPRTVTEMLSIAAFEPGPGKRSAFNHGCCKGCGTCVAECRCGAIEMVPEEVWCAGELTEWRHAYRLVGSHRSP